MAAVSKIGEVTLASFAKRERTGYTPEPEVL
jgi:hypothetical protein